MPSQPLPRGCSSEPPPKSPIPTGSQAVLEAEQRELLVRKGMLRSDVFDPPPSSEGRGSAAEGALQLPTFVRRAGTVIVIGFFIHQTLPRLPALVSRLLLLL